MKKSLNFLSLFFASCFFLSYGPATLIRLLQKPFKIEILSERRWSGAGLVGSLFGAATYLFLPSSWAHSFWALGAGVLLSVLISHHAEKVYQSHDDTRIVIDEWIGAWIALWGLGQHIGPPVIIAFTLFRVFDVIKGPWGGNLLQKLPGGWGITMDDVGAALLANLTTRFLLIFL